MPGSLKTRVARRLAELDRNPFEAARIGGLQRSFVNDILIDRKRTVGADKLEALARALDWTVTELSGAVGKGIPVMGKIGAGAEIYPEFDQTPPEGLFEIDADIPLPDGMIAFEVEGDSGDVVICSASGVAPEALVAGAEAAVRTDDGRRFIKRVRRENGAFTLESHNAAPIRDVHLTWASEVVTVVRARLWRSLARSTEKRKSISRALRGKSGK